METNPEFHSAEDARMQHHRNNVRGVEERIAALHERRGVSESGDLGFEESFELDDPLRNLMNDGEKILGLNEVEGQEMRTILRKLLRGSLNEDDEQRLAGWLGRYEEEKGSDDAY